MRMQRQLSETVKDKISRAMKKHHAYRTEAQKERTRKRQSEAMKEYWATIPYGEKIDSPIRTTKPPTNISREN